MYLDEDLQFTGAQITDPGDRFPYLLIDGEDEAMYLESLVYVLKRGLDNPSEGETRREESLKLDIAALRVKRFFATVKGFYTVCLAFLSNNITKTGRLSITG